MAESDGLETCPSLSDWLATNGLTCSLPIGSSAEKAPFGSVWRQLLPKKLPKTSDGHRTVSSA